MYDGCMAVAAHRTSYSYVSNTNAELRWSKVHELRYTRGCCLPFVAVIGHCRSVVSFMPVDCYDDEFSRLRLVSSRLVLFAMLDCIVTRRKW